MAHEYRDAAKKAHDKKLASYGGKSKDTDHWAGLKDINTSKQAGMKVIDKEPELSEETAPRIMRKAGGAVKGAMSLKRLDKAPRGKKPVMGGTRTGEIPSPQKQEEKFDATTRPTTDHMKDVARRKDGGVLRHKKNNGGPNELPPPEDAIESEKRLKGLKVEPKNEPEYPKSLPPASDAIRRSGKFQNYKKGGKIPHMEWEHSKADLEQDKKLAKKHGMSMEKWEKSALDKKHDEQQSTEGLKKGGRAKYERGGGDIIPSESDIQALNRGRREAGYEDQMEERGFGNKIPPKAYRKGNLGEGEYAMNKGGRAKRASGGSLMGDDDMPKSHGKKGAGKTIVNIMVGAQPQPSMATPASAGAGINPALLAALTGGPQGGPPPMPPAPPPGAGAPPPAMAGGPPPMMGPGAGGPMMRKDGGKVQVPYKKPGRKGDYPAMDFGAGSGFGRKQKIDAYGDK